MACLLARSLKFSPFLPPSPSPSPSLVPDAEAMYVVSEIIAELPGLQVRNIESSKQFEIYNYTNQLVYNLYNTSSCCCSVQPWCYSLLSLDHADSLPRCRRPSMSCGSATPPSPPPSSITALFRSRGTAKSVQSSTK